MPTHFRAKPVNRIRSPISTEPNHIYPYRPTQPEIPESPSRAATYRSENNSCRRKGYVHRTPTSTTAREALSLPYVRSINSRTSGRIPRNADLQGLSVSTIQSGTRQVAATGTLPVVAYSQSLRKRSIVAEPAPVVNALAMRTHLVLLRIPRAFLRPGSSRRISSPSPLRQELDRRRRTHTPSAPAHLVLHQIHNQDHRAHYDDRYDGDF